MKATTAPVARLLSDDEAASYIGTSRSYVRALAASGVLRRVELPTTDGTPGRARLLRFDVRDLDSFIEALPRQP